MRILVAGATGFLGFTVTRLLIERGYEVICAVKNTTLAKRHFPEAEVIYTDFSAVQNESEWVNRLETVDVVINCVGIFYHPNPEILWNVHYHSPVVLFRAAEKAGVKRIIHVSALGVEKYHSAYAQSKRASEIFLEKELTVPYFILKPSFIYGRGVRGGMALLEALASLPFIIPLPNKGKQLFQPIFIDDLAQIIFNLIPKNTQQSAHVACVGKDTMCLKDILFALRLWLGEPKKIGINIPQMLLNIGGKIGSWLKTPLINQEAIEMLNQGNIATPEEQSTLVTITGVEPIGFDKGLNTLMSTEQDKWHARLFFLKPLLRFSLVFMWLASALTSAVFFHAKSFELLKTLGLPVSTHSITLYSAAGMNFLVGIHLLWGKQVKFNCAIQIIIILLYSIIISVFLPIYWLEPFGPIVKNVPILVAILILYSLE